ncbi:hypothetical protein RclHR1_00510004 [Rhizophagus clarus]|uniref:Uncharacterized protein n=1 Tax=Rhizophagus clarus TaxID=94130 RepID=A0A2Z6RR47_9GLOM|nr:hypothetical protein RclHR1_00510004 [Rhizophagus clarus]
MNSSRGTYSRLSRTIRAISNREQELLDRIACWRNRLTGLPCPKRTRVQMDRKHRIEGLKEYIREMEKPLALENNEMLQVYCTNETPSKPINEWTFPKVCELYGLSEKYKPPKASIRILISQLIHLKIELIESENGRRNLDYGIESRTTGRIICLIEVKKDGYRIIGTIVRS